MSGKVGLLSPLFLKYQAEYEKNPKSRVFAPLAEMYRKVGMLDRAMEILGAGIRNHPKYILGHLGMAHCYFDLQQFSLAYSALKPFLESSRDNLRLQKLFADASYRLDKKEEALNTYKYLLFMQPKDKEVAELVDNLEKELENLYRPIHHPISIEANNILNEDRNLKMALDGVDSWVQLPINEKARADVTEEGASWEMQKAQAVYPSISEDDQIDLQTLEIREKSSEENSSDSVAITFNVEEANKAKISAPIVTHTLVDLYIAQGHVEKALELLEKILLLNPDDERTHKKIMEINQLLNSNLSETDFNDATLDIDNDETTEELIEIDEILGASSISEAKKKSSEKRKNLTEDDGHRMLMDEIGQIKVDTLLVDSLNNSEKPRSAKKSTEQKMFIKQELILTSFLNKIKTRAEKFRSL